MALIGDEYDSMLDMLELSPRPQVAKDDDEWGPSGESRDVDTYGEEHVAYRIGSI
jgi:hypothetical protein